MVIIVALATCMNLNSQNNPLSMGVKVGMNLSSMSGDVNDADSRLGYQFGVTFNYDFSENLFLETGLEFTLKGYDEKADMAVIGGVEVMNAKQKCNAQYIQIPIHIGYKMDVATDVKISFLAGPYLAYGVGGKTKLTGYVQTGDYWRPTIDINEKANTFSTGALKEFDFGFGFGVGAEYQKYVARLGYDFGMVNVSEKFADEKMKLRNRNAYLTFGYKF